MQNSLHRILPLPLPHKHIPLTPPLFKVGVRQLHLHHDLRARPLRRSGTLTINRVLRPRPLRPLHSLRRLRTLIPYYSYPYYHYAQHSQPHPPPAPPEPIERIEKVARNYVIHELSQEEKQRPPWYSTMSAMFGDHVKWEELRVYTSKGRPLCKCASFPLVHDATLTPLLARPVLPCPITGRAAKYKDPRTNVPFADVAAYETLTRVLGHEYVWSDSLGCYTG